MVSGVGESGFRVRARGIVGRGDPNISIYLYMHSMCVSLCKCLFNSQCANGCYNRNIQIFSSFGLPPRQTFRVAGSFSPRRVWRVGALKFRALSGSRGLGLWVGLPSR